MWAVVTVVVVAGQVSLVLGERYSDFPCEIFKVKCVDCVSCNFAVEQQVLTMRLHVGRALRMQCWVVDCLSKLLVATTARAMVVAGSGM